MGMFWVYLGIYLVFAKAIKFCHASKLFSIVFKCTDTPLKHNTLYFGAKSEKKICADHEFCNPWLYWYVSYILVHTRTYSYILSPNTMYFISGWSCLVMTYYLCCTHVQCIAHSILPVWGLLDGQASQAGLATPKLPQPQDDLVDIANQQSVRCSRADSALLEVFGRILFWNVMLLYIKWYTHAY